MIDYTKDVNAVLKDNGTVLSNNGILQPADAPALIDPAGRTGAATDSQPGNTFLADHVADPDGTVPPTLSYMQSISPFAAQGLKANGEDVTLPVPE